MLFTILSLGTRIVLNGVRWKYNVWSYSLYTLSNQWVSELSTNGLNCWLAFREAIDWLVARVWNANSFRTTHVYLASACHLRSCTIDCILMRSSSRLHKYRNWKLTCCSRAFQIRSKNQRSFVLQESKIEVKKIIKHEHNQYSISKALLNLNDEHITWSCAWFSVIFFASQWYFYLKITLWNKSGKWAKLNGR